MVFSDRMNSLAIAVFGHSLNSTKNKSVIATQLDEICRRLDLLNRNLQINNPFSPEELAYIDRFRLERRMLENWQGTERDKLVARLRAIFSKLGPSRVIDRRKARFGSKNDGGYIILDDFENIDTVLSFGVEHNAEFDLQMAERGMLVRQYDHTITSAPNSHPSIVWERKKISPELGEGTDTLVNLIHKYDKGRDHPNIILKIDIEHDEWPVFDTTPEQYLGRLAQITGEFHGFDYLADRQRLEIVERVFGKLSKNFATIHVHANNYCDITNIFGLSIPYVLEFTFVNRSIYEVEESFEIFPSDLDAPCNPNQPDIILGMFRY